MSYLIFWTCFGSALLVLCVIERVFNAALVLLFGKGDVRAGLLVGSVLNLGSVAASAAVSAAARCVGLLGWLILWYALFYVLTAVWFVLYEDHPQVVYYVVDFYSKRVGPFLHGFLFLPLDLLNLVLKAVLPLYNSVVWVLRSMLTKGLLPILFDELDLLVDFCVSSLSLAKSLVLSVVSFVWNLDCDDNSCIERPAVLDLLEPMGHVRDMAVVASRFAGVVCSTLAVPLDWVLYPLVDVRFSRGLHSLVNSFFHLTLHVPRGAAKRCDAYATAGSPLRVLMCTPDLDSIFDHAISGVRDLGVLVDNWLGVGAAMARRSLTGLPDDCSGKSLSPDTFRGEALSGLQVVVGLTDWLTAAANGTRAYFFGQVTTDAAVKSWPEPVDVRMGLAAVAFDEAGEVEVSGVTQGQRPATRQTTSLLGCRCLDTDSGIVVRCSVLPLQGNASAETHAFDVLFQDRTWAAGMQCRSAEVSVRSVRWPARRYEGKSVPFSAGYLDEPSTDCMSRGSCESVDATIWLVPRCDLLRPEQCSDLSVGTSCFPFCMAARVSGSRNANPVFVNSEVWRGGKQLLMRACALRASASPAASATLATSRSTVATLGYSETTLSGAASGGVFVSGAGDGTECLSGANLASWVPSNATKADPRAVPSYVRRRGQPFAISGDALLIEFAKSDGASTVEVDRLYGNQRDVYSLVPGWAGLPAAPKFLVPVQELTSEERSRVVVPLDYVTARVPSASSRNYMFYAVSPDMRIFQAYLGYCSDPNSLPQAQIMMLSSYSALRVYRVRAYCQESCEAGDLAAQFTFDGFSDGKFTAANFPRNCSRVYNASIDALEYVNEQNLAVTVQVADRTYDPVLRVGSNSTYATYWLNPQTMRARAGEMWPAEIPSSLTAGLCVVADGVPHLGTLGAELGVAGLHLINQAVGALLYAPGMIAFWRGGAACPLESRGHSVLASCGQSYLNLDDFFDSLDSAAAVFWGIPGWIAEQLEQGRVVDYSPVSDLLRGFGDYGRGAVGITEIQSGVVSLLNTPLPAELAGVYALIRNPGVVAGGAKMVGSASSWARFSSRFFLAVGAAVAQKLAVSGSLDLGELWRDMVNTLYDHRPFFKSTVADRGLSACLGLEMMLGGANPWGRVLYHSCLSSVRIVDGAMDVFLHAFVDAPMVKCVCKDSEGRSVGEYARANCVWRAPKTMQPTLLGMVGASEGLIGGDSLLCPAVIAYTRAALERSMAPYFTTVFSALDALGDSVDYLLSAFDSDAGQCSNFRADPQVVVIMPEPVDYFRGCGAASYCKAKCAGNWDAFDAERAKYDPERLTASREMQRTVDSLFFPSVVADMIAPGRVVALVRPDVCGTWVCRTDSEECLAVASVVELQLQVAYFCVPSTPAATVYATEQGTVNWVSTVGYDASRVAFMRNDGTAMAALVNSKIVLLRKETAPKIVMDVSLILSLPLVGMYPLRIVDFLPVRGRMLVSVAVRKGGDATFERDMATVWFDPFEVNNIYADMSRVPASTTGLTPEFESLWRHYSYDVFPVVLTSPVLKDLWKGYATSEYPSDDLDTVIMLMWPTTTTGFLRRLTLTWTNLTVSPLLEPIEQSQSLAARATLMPRQLVLSKTLREDAVSGQVLVYASAGNVYDWLRQLRLTGTGLQMSSASLSNAQPITASIGVRASCDGLDCRGCPDLALRSLCSAYQSCAVFRCIGTPVNLKRPLCGVGQVLRSVGNMGVASVQGAWIMFVDIFMILLQLSTVRNLPGVDVNFPDDSFLGNMCAAKDLSAEFFSILTSTVNSILQKVQGAVGRFSHLTSVDANVNTVVSLSMAAITGFLHQIALAPVYVLAVGHKIMMCQVSGFLAVTGSMGLRVDIQPAQFSSTDAISGRCLTVGAEVDSQQTGEAPAVRGIAAQAAEILTGVGQAAVMRKLEPYMHMVDGFLTYLIGVTAKLADVLQATDIQHCVLPDVTLKDTVRCACGDQPLAIAERRRAEGLAAKAYWCTGTISVISADNRVQVVWNPYTYAELQGVVGGRLDQYVQTASERVSVDVPNDPVFAEQGVSMFAVLTRCRQNYVNKQWDPMAFVRYDSRLAQREVKGAAQVAYGDAGDGVGQCLLDSAASGAGNGACMDAYLRSVGGDPLYWGYSVASDTVTSDRLDACLVFSGPASNVAFSDARRKPFKDCLGGYANESACDLSGFVWSPGSDNAVPVAVRHPVAAGSGLHLREAVAQRMKEASDMVMSKLQAIGDYSNDELQAALFSAEGDVIHQLMDCVFMGPYARMDYWPVPRCDEGERDDCLVGPYWSRDAGRGKTRRLDIDTCEAAEELPFTCGSPTRKGMVRDFVKQYLETGAGGAEIVVEMVKKWIANQSLTWFDPETFHCNCTGCCEGHLPKKLASVSLQLSTRGIMNALEARLKLFYRRSMLSPDPWISFLATDELAKYDWPSSGGANQVNSHAAYHPSGLTFRYTAEDAASPPLTELSPGLWRICHSALKQVMWSVPVDLSGQVQEGFPEFAGGGPSAIEAHVRELVKVARERSPLFRHYQARHHPSPSLLCNGSAGKDARLSRGTVQFTNYAVSGNVILAGSEVPAIPALGYDAGVLGAPWSGALPGLTEHLGFLDRDATERWLRGDANLQTSGEFLLRHGAGGLKVGNLPGSGSNLSLPAGFAADLDAVLRAFLSEADRSVPVQSGRLHGCEEHKKNVTQLLGIFVDGLFPMAQGVKESGVGSYCLRFAVELAMLYAMELEPSIVFDQLVAQKELAASWRRKCGTQVQLVGMCSALDLYHPGGVQTASCMMQWQLQPDPAVEMYLTPECLAKIGDSFYDPCRCRPDWCEPRETTLVLTRAALETEECRVKFDPRSVVQSAELGWWSEDEADPAAAAWNAWLEEPVNLLDLPGMRESLLADGQGVGNVPAGRHWMTAEGFMNETGEFCDMVADYWPEEAMFPAGYHVTTPCHQDDAGYRTFDNVFALEFAPDGSPRMVYLEDQTRDADLVDSHFGAGGLCRGVNFGMDMYETNTMRVCTRLTDGEDVDVHVPLGNITRRELGLPRCSDSSTELPWGDETYYDYYDAAFYSVGTVPNLPSASASLYPESGDRYLRVGPQHAMREEGWGDSCQDFAIPNCLAGDWKCPEGFYCKAPGVCQHRSVECTQHADCGGGQMCSGLGTCEVPKVSMLNELGENASVRAHTSRCAGESFSMLGASYWGYVPDLLETHGMCSYRHWQEYLYTMQKCSCTSVAGDACQLQAETCPFYRFSKQQIVNKWWNSTDSAPSRLKMIPTTCDRNYERFTSGGQEMKACVPDEARRWLVFLDGSYQRDAERDKLWRIYDEGTRRVAVKNMPFKTQPGLGFLGVENVDNIKSCMSIQQCYVDDFTKNGRLAMVTTEAVRRADRTIMGGQVYDPNDQFRCGVVGYYDKVKKKCVVDEKLFPLYYVLCREQSRVGVGKCQASLKAGSLPARCDDVQMEYSPEYSVINDVVVPALNAFFYAFEQPKNLAEHLNLVECMEYVYGVMSAAPFESKGLYVPFTFTLYEIPFPWFYQCMLGSGIEVPLTLEKKVFACTFYRNRNVLGQVQSVSEGYYRDFKSYVFNMRGGYRKTPFIQSLASQLALANAAWQASVEEVRSALFGVGGTDLTYPRCFSELQWVLPNENRYKRKMIEAYVRNTCASDLLSYYIQLFNQLYGTNINAQTAIAELTTPGGNMVSQGTALTQNRLLTGLIKSWGLELLSTRSSLEKINIAVTPVEMDYSLPSVTSPEFAAKKQAWKSISNVLPNQKDVRTTELPNVGQLKMVYQDMQGNLLVEEDTDRQAGLSTSVMAYSVYAQGLFSCSYSQIEISSQVRTLSGASSDISADFDAYVDLLYSEVKRRYDLKMAAHRNAGAVGPIALHALDFYTQESTLGFGSAFQVDLRAVANYINNINPDIRTPVMCVAGNQQVDFNKCSDPNFAALKDHVSSKYTKNGGLVVPQLAQLDWEVDRTMMASGAIFSYASTERNVSKRYLGMMFDEDSVCGASATTSTKDRLCYITTTGSVGQYSVIAPWMAGWWNPFDKCDVDQLDLQSGNAETIDSLCYFSEYCPDQSATLPYYQNMPNRQCKDRDNQRATHINVNSRLQYNLCRHRLNEDSVCLHKQGMLGGSDGFPSEDYDVNGNLFTLHNFSSVPAGDDTPFGNVLLSGGSADYGFVSSKSGHIGGHHLGLKITADRGMRVAKVPLKPLQERARMERWDSADSSEWVPGWASSLAADDVEYAKTARDAAFIRGTDGRGKPIFGWDCPLRRRAFWGGDVENFKPSLPSARRSRMLFGGLTGDAWAHPTQPRQDGSARFGRYKTTNGFCFCPTAEEVWPGMCSVDTQLREGHNCSLYNTVRALRGKAWGWSHTFRPRNRQNEFKTCGVQVDWPFVEGTLRDNSTVEHDDVDAAVWAEASDVEARRCHVLDRAPDFAYAYVSKNELRKSGVSTLLRGVCRTGRAQKRHGSSQRCVRLSRNFTVSTLRCADNSGAVVDRPRSKLPIQSFQSSMFYRRRCGKCTRPPKFVTRGGQEIPAESSFGVPYRVSMERVLARDLREALCANMTSCANFLNASAWKVGQFLPALLRKPELLFSKFVERPSISKPYEPRPDLRPDDSGLWSKNWAYCPSREALRTGQGCNGSISKARWRANKVGVCYSTILEALGDKQDPFAATDICNIDSRLTDLCKAIREAQSLVAAANCLKSGDPACALQEFVYNPSTWETTNQAFVHQTVQEYYTRVDGCSTEGDCVCQADSVLQELRRNNSYRLRECAAAPVMAFRSVLVRVRELIFTICKIASLLIDIFFNLILSISSGARDVATSSIILSWAQLKQEAGIMVDKLSDMFFDMLFSLGTMGPWLKRHFLTSCEVVNSAYLFTANFWCNLVVRQLPLFLGALQSIGGWIDLGFSVVNDVFSAILDDQLPNAVMALYQYGYREYFQSSRYNEKQAAYEERKQAGLLNAKQRTPSTSNAPSPSSYGGKAPSPAYNKLLQNLGEARESRLQSTKMDSATGLVGLLGGAGKFLGPLATAADLGITVYQTYSAINSAIQIKQMLEKFPTSFTLFDFDEFKISIEGLVEFLNADFTCYTMDVNVPPLQCTLLNFTEPSVSDVDLMAPRASVCWAEAQQRQVGVSNLYSCTPTSTCCSDPLNCDNNAEGVKLCDECPVPPAGARSYGCNTMIQRCQCGVENYQVDRCGAQRDCGRSASCSLLTSLDDVSFGSLRTCTECATSPICLMGSSQQYGTCTCLTSADAKVDLCSAPVGASVNPSVSKLCGYARDAGGYYAWGELSLVLCANAVSPVCAEVMTETGSLIYMAVATRLRGSQVAYSSRRLLSVGGDEQQEFYRLPSALLPEDPADDVTPEVVHKSVMELEWNHTSAPCSTLAHAYRVGQPLGPVDEATLHSCVYWRSVARQLIQEHDMKAMRRLDTFLLSSSDFSATLGQRGVMEELMSKPWVLLHAMLFTHWAKPVRAALVASHDANVSAMLSKWSAGLKRKTREKLARPIDVREVEKELEEELEDFELNDTGITVRERRGRRLMGLWEETRDRIRSMPFYSMVKGAVMNVTLPPSANLTAAQFWLLDAFAWKGVRFTGSCPLADAFASLVRQALVVSKNYYQHMAQMDKPLVTRRRFRDVLPVIAAPNISLPSPSRPAVFAWIMDTLGIRMEDLVSFLSDPCPRQECIAENKWTASYLIESAVFCDLESVMFCSTHRNDMVLTTVMMIVGYIAVSYLCGFFGLYGVSTFFFLSIPLLVVWYSLGVSPRCFPMLPTCLLDDVIHALKSLFPVKALIPPFLAVNKTNLRSCSELNFTSWEDPLAFAVCDLGFCDGLNDTDVLGLTRWNFGKMRKYVSSSNVDAYRVCASVTATYSIPAALVFNFIFAAAAVSVISIMVLFAPCVGVFWQVVMFNHSDEKEDI